MTIVHRFPPPSKKNLIGWNFKTIHLGLFKIIKSYWCMTEVVNGQIQHIKVPHKTEIKFFFQHDF